MMQLQTTTDYGIRIMRCLYNKDSLISAPDLSEQLCISYPYLLTVLRKLKQAGLIEVVRGRLGGYRIADGARNITLYGIIKIMEGEIWVNTCLCEDGVCTMNAIDTCSVHTALKSAQKQLVDNLSRVSLSDIAEVQVNQAESMPSAEM